MLKGAEQLRVLAAALSFSDSFSAADLVAATGVKLATVRTVLRRRAEVLKEIGRAHV